jgi:DNA-binding CsgD family transcriptional regulator
MLEKIEFYNCPDGSILVKPDNKPVFVYEMSCKQITQELLLLIRDLYPGAFAKLSEIYSKSERNKDFYEYKICHRFIRCNFGEYDALTYDIETGGKMNLEDVKCPLRGECLFEGTICKPAMQTQLSAREQEVAELLATGITRQEVADELQISIYTVTRHIANIKARMHFQTTAQIISHFSK